MENDSYYAGDWGIYLDNYLGGDIDATPFYAVEWIKVRPRRLEHQGRLIESKVIDETDQFLEILQNLIFLTTNKMGHISFMVTDNHIENLCKKL